MNDQSNGQPTKYAWEGGCAIATTLDAVGLPMKLDRAVAVLVTTAEGKSVVVIFDIQNNDSDAIVWEFCAFLS